jgi:hypothetical protein
MIPRIFLIISMIFFISTFASTRLDTDSLGSLIIEYTLGTNPAINPNFKITVTEYNVDALWDSMGIQIADAVFRSEEGTWFKEQAYLFRNGTVTPFTNAFGGYGLMSGVMLGQKFYYTYSWGSGIHRSQVGYLYIDHDSPVFHESGGYVNADLFISKSAGDTIYVCSGAYNGFNSLTTKNACLWGAIINDKFQIIVVDSTGKEVVPNFPPVGTLENTDKKADRKCIRPYAQGTLTATDFTMVNVKGQIVRKQMHSSVVVTCNDKCKKVTVDHRNLR